MGSPERVGLDLRLELVDGLVAGAAHGLVGVDDDPLQPTVSRRAMNSGTSCIVEQLGLAMMPSWAAASSG